MTPPSGLGYFGISRLLPFVGPTPSIRVPQHTPNPAGGYTPHLMVDYRCHVAEIRHWHAQLLYDEPKDLRIEYRFCQPFHFDFYHHLVYLHFINKREALVVQMKSIDTYELGKLPSLELKQMITDMKRMGLEQLMEFRKPSNNEIICHFYASYHLDTREATHVIH